MDYIERLLKYFEENNIKGTEIAKILGLAKTPLTDWKNKKSNPTVKQLITICENFALSFDWLIKGVEKEISNDEENIINLYKKLNERNKGKVELFIEQKLEEQESGSKLLVSPNSENKNVG